jgi:hypothetical protein
MTAMSASVHVTNGKKGSTSLCIEPWGEVFRLEPGDSLLVTFLAPALLPIPIVCKDDMTIVEGWERATVEVWKGTTRLY